ncbi:MAG: helix-turn-helix domain-containing protein [bacterium]|nr:helix-turn-helix domain-containing protein [bacterium]
MLSEGGNVTRVAKRLGCSRKTVYDWCSRYGIRIRE